jgi:serine/threonine protein kinase
MCRYPLLPAGKKPTLEALICTFCFGELSAIPDGAAALELRDFMAACLHKDHCKRASLVDLLAHPFVRGRDVTASRHALFQVIEQRCR